MREVVAVLRGGPSSEYDVSLLSGSNVLESLDREKYDVRDLFVSRSGEWHSHGVPLPPERALKGVDVAFNVLHGHYGESGEVQRLLEALNVPYTGADALASAIAFNKHLTRQEAARLGIKVPHGRVLDWPGEENLGNMAHELFRTFPHPAIVKPIVGGSSVGMSVADSYHGLENALAHAFGSSQQVLVEEFIKGKEASVGVIDEFRGEKAYALLPIEIVPPPTAHFFDYDSKYGGQSTERVPGLFAEAEKRHLMTLARMVHQELGLTHYSRSDFIVSKRGIYFLEANSAAAVGLTKESLLPKALRAVGAKFSDFLDHILSLARRGRAA